VTDRNRWMALYVLCVGVLMIVLDVTVVNVALPSIQDDLGFSQSSLAWVVNAYLIAFGGLLLLAGRFGDLLGRKRSSSPASPSSPWRRSCAVRRRARGCSSWRASCRESEGR
jgi:MFS family permease